MFHFMAGVETAFAYSLPKIYQLLFASAKLRLETQAVLPLPGN